jgi:hypothetical protein
MRRFEIIESGINKNKIKIPGNIILHKNIFDVLFNHKKEIYMRLIDLQGPFLIDHIAIKIINPNDEIIIFSITPSVEYNLIVQGLWKFDHGFLPTFQKLNKLQIWDDAYEKEYFNEIKSLKENKHGFTLGFNIYRNHGTFNFIYSFATRSKNNNLYDYYNNHIDEISELGDYGYKSIQSIYSKYCHPEFRIPSITDTEKTSHPVRSLLKLIVSKNNI